MFELHTAPAPAGLAMLGSAVELRELPYGRLMEALAAGGASLLAASLHIDGKPIGAEALDAIPGRYAADLVEARRAVETLHDLDRLLQASAADTARMEARRAATADGADAAPKA
jgi:hypothetical protein